MFSKKPIPNLVKFFSETMIIIDQNHWMSIRLTCTLIQIYRHHSLQYLFIIISIMYTYGVCWSFVSFLMLAVMPGDGSMSCLGFDGLAIGANQYTGHHPERSKAYENQQQVPVHLCSCICNLNVRVNVHLYNTEHLQGQNYTVKALPWWVQTPTLGYRVGLDISIVVLARPHESSLRLHCVGDHVVNQSVLIPNLLLLKGLLVLPEATDIFIIISVSLM